MNGPVSEGDPSFEKLLEELEAARFLAKASATIAHLDDYEGTLERIATLAVPAFADWFGVHVLESDGSLRRIAVKHQDPKMETAVDELYRRYPPAEGRLYGAPQVIASGTTLWAPHFNALIPAVARDHTHGDLLRGLGLRSYICVPMRSHDTLFGALTFATAESGREYNDIHLRAAEDIAARCATAIENAHLLERLRVADRRKDEFLAMLAHELRNPLAPVRNAVEILKARPALQPEAKWVTEVIDRQVGLLSRLIEDLLDVSRISRGKIELRKESVALADVIAAAVESATPAMERAGQKLHVSLPPHPIRLVADPVRISQVLTNLLNNAVKYTPPGGHITLSAAREASEAVIRVADNGAGIPQAMLERIFEMFVQLPRLAGQPQGGLGIGLTLVRRLVELHGGSVKASSAGEGQGSEFVVRLPALG